MTERSLWHNRHRKVTATLTNAEYDAFVQIASAGGKTPTGMTTDVIRQFIASNSVAPKEDDFLDSPNVYGDGDEEEVGALDG